ncbi:MAG TPA: class I SAM-dependent methyltransferase [Chloroflexia bacterium]|jgi:SAM-dependent methyltransferase
MTSKYDPAYIRDYFERWGEREWQRLDVGPADRVSFHLHRWHLERYIKPGDRILEVGAGPGRFTIELAKLGATITVGDISPVQLELNRRYVQEAGHEQSVVTREVLDMVDLSRFPSESYDAVVCYGGPLSYVFDRADDAISEMLRVTKPGGFLLLSVMSLVGSARALLPEILAIRHQIGLDLVNQVNTTGDLYGEAAVSGHICHMYRWSELEALLKRHAGTIVAASASNFLSIRHEEALREIESDPVTWQALLQWEVDYCREPGALDGGTHMIAVMQRG